MRKFGKFDLGVVNGGEIWLDGGAMFGVVPRPVWEGCSDVDEANRIRLTTRLLLVLDESGPRPRRILVDVGIGDKFSAKQAKQLRLSAPEGGIRESVARAGVAPDDITDVVLTHLHFDHAGGASMVCEGQVQPSFPDATYHVQRRAWKWATHPTEKDRGSFHAEDYEVLAKSGNLHLLDGPTELFEGFSILISEGHTVGQQLPLIDGGDQGFLFYPGDVIPLRSHVRLPWMMSYDLYPLTTLEEKRLLLAQGLEEGWILCFDHDPVHAACHLAEEDGHVVAGEPFEL